MFTQKGEIEIWLNQRHTPFLDIAFSILTFMGDGFFVLLVCILYLFIRFYEALVLLLVYIFSGIPVQILKNTLFLGEPRPKVFFENIAQKLHFVKGLEIHSYNSFPSGHSATAFAIMLFFAMFLPEKHRNWGGVCCFLIAFLIATSRIYLLQHFFIDTFVGALIGTVTAFLVIGFIENRTELKDKIFWQKRIKLT
ncbi:MAG: phosphatase PAP2 family protein [Microscillaceae bacterium]|nr:phosphatase PAP2 family protein [Microscillaceae bacterium]MDW8460736.1 phosphatase PAP2 family protein [Cytophagales bacterium]